MENKGFTLIELLVAMAIASIVGVAGLAVFSSTNRAYLANEDVAEAQQNVRIAAERLSKDIRMAGFGLPDPPFTIGFDTNDDGVNDLNLTSPISFTDGGAGASDSITVMGGGYLAGTLIGTLNTAGATSLCYSPSGGDDKFFKADGTSDKVPYSNRKNISLNGTTFITLQANEVKATCPGGIKLTLGSPAIIDKDYGDGTPVFIIQAVNYSINTALAGCSPTNPCLASTDYTQLRGGASPVDPLVVAEGIEDIQFAYGLDANPRDSKLDYTGAYTSAAFLDSPADPSVIFAVRASIVAKARNVAPNGGSAFTRPLLENHTASAADAYRRRILQKIIKLRNPRQGA